MIYLDKREKELLSSARDVIRCFGLGEHGVIDDLAAAISVYDEAEEVARRLDALPSPARATILPDQMYHTHCWVITEGGFYPAHAEPAHAERGAGKVYGPNDLHIVDTNKPHQFCVGCAGKMFDLEVREMMVTEEKLRKLQR